MKDLGLKLNPLTKLKIYNTAKNIIVSKMNNNLISPARALEVINFLKANLVNIKTAEMAAQFYLDAAKKFPELSDLSIHFKNQEDEKYEEVAMCLSENLMGKNDLETTTKIIEELKSLMNQTDRQKYMEKLEKDYPTEFVKAVEKIIQKN